MSLKKKAEIKTGKIIRELMLADQDVSASTIMVYSKNGINEEIKIEGLHPKSNEELFLSGNINWNDKVIYKIVDFSGKAEVGKVELIEVKKNNITLQIDRIMWSKEKKLEEEETIATNDNTLNIVPTPTQLEQEHNRSTYKEKTESKEQSPEPTVQRELLSMPQPELPTVPTKQSELLTDFSQQLATSKEKDTDSNQQDIEHIKHEISPVESHEEPLHSDSIQLQEKYNRLISKSIAVCQDYSLGLDVDNSIDQLKEELELQGITLPLDTDIMKVVNNLRDLKGKGMDIQKLLSLV